MNISRNARGCLLFAAVLNIVAMPARGADAASTTAATAAVRSTTPAAGVVAGKAAAASVARPVAPAADNLATSRTTPVERPKADAKRHTTRRTQRDEYGVVLQDGSYSLFYNY